MAHPDPSTDTQPEHVPHVRAVLDQLDTYSFAFAKAGSHQLARHLQELKIIISTQRWEMINIRLQLEAHEDEADILREERDELLNVMREVEAAMELSFDNPGLVDFSPIFPKIKAVVHGPFADYCRSCFDLDPDSCRACYTVVHVLCPNCEAGHCERRRSFPMDCNCGEYLERPELAPVADADEVAGEECGEPGYLVAWKPCHLPKGHSGGCEHRVVSDPYACDCSDPACGLHDEVK